MTITIQTITSVSRFVIDCKTNNNDAASELTQKLHELLNSQYRDDKPWNTLKELDLLADTHGVEVVNDEAIADCLYDSSQSIVHGQTIAYYLNTGDTYSTTVVYDCIHQRYFIKTIGDYVDAIENIKHVAEQIENFAPNIEWDEWQVDDGESYFPVRLQQVGAYFIPHFGDPGWDTDHQGSWSSSVLVKDMTPQDYLGRALDLVIELAN